MEVYDEQAILEAAIDTIREDLMTILIERAGDHMEQTYVGIPETQYREKINTFVKDEIDTLCKCAADALMLEIDNIAENVADQLDNEYDTANDWDDEPTVTTEDDFWNKAESIVLAVGPG